MTDLVDTFTGSGTLLAHTSDSGHTWADAPDNFFGSEGGSVTVLSGGTLRLTQPSDEYAYFSGQNSYEGIDGYIEAVLNMPSGVTPPGISSYGFYVGMRYVEYWPGNFDGIIAGILVWPSPWTTMLVRLTDQHTQIDNASGVAIANPVTLRLECNGTNARVLVNGSEVCNASTVNPTVNGKSLIMLQQPTSGPLMTIDSLSSIQTIPAAFWQDFLKTVEA